jgi:hypothetical protein
MFKKQQSNDYVPVDGIDLMPGLCLFDFYVHCPQDSQSQMVVTLLDQSRVVVNTHLASQRARKDQRQGS